MAILDNDARCVREGYFQIGTSEPGYPMGYKRGVHGGCSVGEVVKSVLAYRRDKWRENETMWLAVFVEHNGLITRFTATFEPNQPTPKWEISG